MTKCIFLKKLQEISDKHYDTCFYKTLYWNFPNSSGYWFMDQNMEDTDFHLSFLEHFLPDQLDTL